ncbi:hypothetical protein VTJ49DRAFT_5946 [Mycothermus thermophilus]|uniref:Altered inheritance of mitochondria protein 24, mitochondrial n=1 Tax=Humicola insolens TaxID=85995 RepID=A0ABR3VKF4_HUMIN
MPLAYWGNTHLTGRGLAALAAPGQVYELELAEGEEIVLHPSHVVAYPVTRNPPRPFRFRSTKLTLQVPRVPASITAAAGRLMPERVARFWNAMRDTDTYKTLARLLYGLRTAARRTIWGDRLFMHFEGPMTVLMSTRGVRVRDVLSREDVNEIADAEAGVVPAAVKLATEPKEKEVKKVEEKVAIHVADVKGDGKVSFEDAKGLNDFVSIVLPWAAVGVLVVMVGAQIVLAPIVLLHHIRILADDVVWAVGWLGVAAQLSAQTEHESTPVDEDDIDSTWEDITSLPLHQFSPLPCTSPATIRLLTLYPGPFDSPLRGTLTTVTLPNEEYPKSLRNSSYIYLSYPNPDILPGTNLPSPGSPSGHTEEVLLHDPPTTANTTMHNPKQWRTLPIPTACASSLRRLRHLHYNQSDTHDQHAHHHPSKLATNQSLSAAAPLLRVWTADACVNRADAGERTAHSSALRERIICAAEEVVAVVDAGVDVDAEERKLRCGVGLLLEWVNGIPEEDVRRRLRNWWRQTMGMKVEDEEDETGFELRSLLRGPYTGMAGERRRTGTCAVAVSMVPEIIRALAWTLAEKFTPGLLERMSALSNDLDKTWRRRIREARKAWATLNFDEIYHSGTLLNLPHPSVVSPPPPPPPEDIPSTVREFFSQPWFRQLTSLLETGLPDLARVRFICRGRAITGERVLYLASLLGERATPEERRLGEAFRLLRRPIPPRKQIGSCLLDVLLATRSWQAADPRDAVFVAPRLSESLDRGVPAPARAACMIDYRAPLVKVYAALSARLIKTHGPGLFLSMLKSPPDIKGLPSWAADWTVPWPDRRALAGIPADVCRFRTADARDEVVDFETDEQGYPIVMRGW